MKRIIDEAYAQAETIITEHMDVLHRCAQVIIEREKSGAEFEAIFDGRELPKPECKADISHVRYAIRRQIITHD